MQKIAPLLKESYLTMIKNSKNSRMFANFYVKLDGKRKDITKDGRFSCAYFVSCILKIFGLISDIHLTVKGTIRDLLKSGWVSIRKPKIGSVLVWEEKNFGTRDRPDRHYHIGFYIGNNRAVSNSSSKKKIAIHHFTFNNKRKIVKIYWNKKIG